MEKHIFFELNIVKYVSNGQILFPSYKKITTKKHPPNNCSHPFASYLGGNSPPPLNDNFTMIVFFLQGVGVGQGCLRVPAQLLWGLLYS